MVPTWWFYGRCTYRRTSRGGSTEERVFTHTERFSTRRGKYAERTVCRGVAMWREPGGVWGMTAWR